MNNALTASVNAASFVHPDRAFAYLAQTETLPAGWSRHTSKGSTLYLESGRYRFHGVSGNLHAEAYDAGSGTWTYAGEVLSLFEAARMGKVAQ